MAHHHWQLYLAESNNLNRIAEISREARGKSFSLALNRAGSFNFNLPLSTDWWEYLNPLQHCVIVSKNHNEVWSGPIWTKSESLASERIEISCVGWFQTLFSRFITDANHTYTTTNEGDIAFALLALANDYEIDSVIYPTFISEGSNTSIEDRTRTYERWQNIGQEIQALTEIEASFDFKIDPITREMNIMNESDFADQTEAVFGFNWGPRNVREVTRETDGSVARNEYFVRGQFSTAHTWDTDSIDTYGLYQEVIEIGELSDVGIGAAIANVEVAVNKNPRILINFDPMAESEILTMPSIFEDYDIGDKVYLSAVRHNVEIKEQAIRVFGASISIDENNNETVNSIQVTMQSG